MDEFALTCERIAATGSHLEKIAILAEYFSQLDDENLTRAIRFLTGNPVASAPREQTLFGFEDPPKLAIGHATLRRALQLATGWDLETLRQCQRAVGDTGETVGHLLRDRSKGENLPLCLAEDLLFQLLAERQPTRRESLLAEAFKRHRPLALKYLVKSLSGNFRIGLLSKMVEEAVALSTASPIADLRAANNLAGDLAKTAIAARKGQLSQIEVRLFHPMDFMLAKPLPDPLPDTVLKTLSAGSWLVEDKYDGIRVQVHIENGLVEIYTRGFERVTSTFPELVHAFGSMTGAAILDGEILAWQGDRSLPFTVLQQRLARKKVNRSMMESNPVVFVSYDILYRDGRLLLDCPLEERRSCLEQALSRTKIRIAPQSRLQDVTTLEMLFGHARANGNEGLILKQSGSSYETAKRSGSWLKIKKVFATLDVVVTAAEQGHGKRASMLSDYTFAVLDGNQYLNIGKAYSGLTDTEIRDLTKLLKSIVIGRYGNRVLQVVPSVVLEVGFDGIQRSLRHKSGFALRFPRILRWRTDKAPKDCDTLDRVRDLYESTLNLTANRNIDKE